LDFSLVDGAGIFANGITFVIDIWKLLKHKYAKFNPKHLILRNKNMRNGRVLRKLTWINAGIAIGGILITVVQIVIDARWGDELENRHNELMKSFPK
jgi:hypothetical protein